LKPIVTRTLSGAIYIVLVIGSVFAGRIPFGVVMLLFLILCQSEYLNLFKNTGISIDRISFIAVGIFSYAISLMVLLGFIEMKYLILIIPLLFIPFLSEILRKEKQPIANISFGIAGLIYLVVPFVILNAFTNSTNALSGHNISLLLGFFIIIWANDTFAYLSGMFFGRHKFFERISPKKTWEGTLGGFILGVASGFVLSLFFKEFSPVKWMGYAIIIIIFGTFGDLLESLIKRTLGLKDSGSIMPGHGGILDRFDSILLAAPFAFIYIAFVLNLR